MNIYEAISSIMAEGYAIGKNQKNAQQGFLYRGIDDVMNTFQPLLAKYKVFCVPEVLEHTREERVTARGSNIIYSILKISYTFYAEDGTNVKAVVIGEGMDSGDKASNKALAVGMKYAMFQTFCIPTEDMRAADPDATTPEPSRKKYACAKCKSEIKPTTKKDGTEWGPAEIADYSNKKFGLVLCPECIKAQTK